MMDYILPLYIATEILLINLAISIRVNSQKLEVPQFLESALYRVGMYCTTHFQLIFFLTQIQEAPFEDLHVSSIKFEFYHHFSGLSFIAEVNFWCLPKTVVSCDKFILVIIINFFRRVFSEYTEANVKTLIPLHIILPEICAFVLGFNSTV